jgi:hypothetical protein
MHAREHKKNKSLIIAVSQYLQNRVVLENVFNLSCMEASFMKEYGMQGKQN